MLPTTVMLRANTCSVDTAQELARKAVIGSTKKRKNTTLCSFLEHERSYEITFLRMKYKQNFEALVAEHVAAKTMS